MLAKNFEKLISSYRTTGDISLSQEGLLTQIYMVKSLPGSRESVRVSIMADPAKSSPRHIKDGLIELERRAAQAVFEQLNTGQTSVNFYSDMSYQQPKVHKVSCE